MENELNIAEILKDKPLDIKLWTDIFGEVTLDYVSKNGNGFNVKHHHSVLDKFLPNGKLYEEGALCIYPSKSMRDWSKFAWKKGDVLYAESIDNYCIFNKFTDDEYTTFEGKFLFDARNLDICNSNYFNESTDEFVKVSDDNAKIILSNLASLLGGKLNLETFEIEKTQFKDGDIVTHEENNHIYILEKWDSIMDRIFYHASLDTHSSIGLDTYCGVHHLEYPVIRLATDSEKQQLFDALAKEGKRWNAETKTLENLPKKCKFKPKDWCLMRRGSIDAWHLCQYSDTCADGYYAVGGNFFKECAPYNDKTAHLLGTNGDYEEGGEV